MLHNLLSYLISSATIRANELDALNSLPAISLEEVETDVSEDRYLNMVLADMDALISITPFTPVVSRFIPSSFSNSLNYMTLPILR
jgi:hypothetical protein